MQIARFLFYPVALALLSVSFVPAAETGNASAEFFETRIRPVLANRCYVCHSATPMGGLAVNSRAALLKGGDTGPAIVPGKPDESLLVQAVRHTGGKLQMPLQQAKLSDKEINDLASWVKSGAVWPEAEVPAETKKVAGYVITPEQRAFWAFQPVKKPEMPKVQNESWVSSSIDRFVLARMEEKGLAPNKPAEKRDLLRRATFDLTGLPPKPEDVDAFVNDRSHGAFAKVVDRLLASPQYGERWGRYWLDVARYADDKLNNDVIDPYANSFRYRNWVIDAINKDMPYDLFVKAQIAGDLLENGKNKQLAVGLGFYGLSPELVDDRVDATTRGFLAMTAACAQCHNHKFDPIPTKDFYAIQGVFSSTKRSELDLAADEEVADYKKKAAKVKDLETRIQDFLHQQATQMAEILTMQAPQYIIAARRVLGPAKQNGTQDVAAVAAQDHLDRETLAKWVRYLKGDPKDNQYLKGWQNDSFDLNAFRDQALAILKERKDVDQENMIRKAALKMKTKGAAVDDDLQAVALKVEHYFLWRDFYFSDFYGKEFKQEEDGMLYYGPNRGYVKSDGSIERFLSGEWKQYLQTLRAELNERKAALPPQYAYAHVITDLAKPKNERIQINGQPDNLGEEAPRAFLSILSQGTPKPFEKGSGRLELAESIADAKNPLTARVMVNRIWQHHFGEGLVRTVSNFGRMGEKPSHPELLDYLAADFVDNGWSMKKLHREIMLSATYRLSADYSEKNFGVDPDNRLLWRANRQRLDAESLRDSLLAVSSELDAVPGTNPLDLSEEKNHKRTIYGSVSRRKLDGTLALFDFPNPNVTGEQRMATATALQQLYFLNSGFVDARAKALAAEITKRTQLSDSAKIRNAYRTVLSRDPDDNELKLSLDFVKAGQDQWQHFTKALLSSNEFLFVN